MSDWQQSSFCGAGTCVQVAHNPTTRTVRVRDSKHPDRQPLTFTAEEWAAFVAGVQAGEFGGEPEPITDHVFRTGGNTFIAGIDSGMCVYFGCNRPQDDHAASRTQWGGR